MSHAVADDGVRIALIERQADRILVDLVLLKPAAIGRLENQSVSAMAAVIDETIAANNQIFREHDRGAGGIFGERIALKNVCVGIHVVKPVAHMMNDIVFDAAVVGERKINSVA